MRKTLGEIAGKFNKENISWLLAGKTAAVLQGVQIHSNSLIFLTTHQGCYRIGEMLQDHKIHKVKYRELDALSGHTGLFKVNGIEITLMGDPEISLEVKKILLPISQIVPECSRIHIDKQDIYLIPIPWLLIFAHLTNDAALLSAISAGKIVRKEVVKAAAMIGAEYYLKSLIERFPE